MTQMIRISNRRKQSRRGAVIVLAAFFMIGLVAVLSMAIDIGYLLVARSELQRSADSAAMAAAWGLADEGMFRGDPYLSEAISDARVFASEYARLNSVCSASPSLNYDFANQNSGDIVIGYLANWRDPNAAFDFSDPSRFNAVTVSVHRSENTNGLVPSFFSKILGVQGFVAEAKATAALSSQIGGFRVPKNGQNIRILPFALDEVTWNDLIAGVTEDNWGWDSGDGEVVPVPDGIREVNLYPQGTGSPGNRGTIDIGSNNNSTNDIARQILHGVSPADLEYHDGELIFDENGELGLNGDTGISAGVKDELEEIKGEPRIIPIFRSVSGPGNNAMYVIVKFVGVRIMEVKLTGKMNNKRVIIQPAPIIASGVIPTVIEGTSDLVFTPVLLVR